MTSPRPASCRSSERSPASAACRPQRTCVGCRRRRLQTELVRCVLAPDGSAQVSRTGAGRGAWVCASSEECIALAVQRKGFERAWRRPVGRDALAELVVQLGRAT